jgi:hypothetical protein
MILFRGLSLLSLLAVASAFTTSSSSAFGVRTSKIPPLGMSAVAEAPASTASGAFTADNIRNIAVIAHVDHGKTTLVDALIRQSGVFRDENQANEAGERVMDSEDQEKERGITILSKNLAVQRNGVKINIMVCTLNSLYSYLNLD